MPELPEVETVVRHVNDVLRGKTFSHLEVFWKNSFWITNKQGSIQNISLSKRIHEANHILFHRSVEKVIRRGKWIVITFSNTPVTLGIHLRMTGRIQFSQGAPDIGPYDRVLVTWSPHQWMIFQDMRKFGKVILDPFGNGPWTKLGIEPLDGAFEELFPQMLKHHRGKIKPLLLNQRFIAGVGNIYADESLYLARIRPTRTAASLTQRERLALTQAIPDILKRALQHGGSTIRNYRNAKNQEGSFQSFLQVYDRSGKDCFRCKDKIRHIVIGQRGTSYCPSCQR